MHIYIYIYRIMTIYIMTYIYIYIYRERERETCNFSPGLVWFGLVSLFNGISTFMGYLMPKLFSEKNSSGTI